MIDLKPCPYCGAGEATDNNNASFSGVELMAAGTDRPYVWCGTCCASARMADTEAEAIAAWNRRTTELIARTDAEMAVAEAIRRAVEIGADIAQRTRPDGFPEEASNAYHSGAMDVVDAIRALIDKPAPDHSAAPGNMIYNPSNPGG